MGKAIVHSAGIRREAAGLPADPRAIQCVGDRGLDLTNHCSRWAGDICVADYDFVLCVDSVIAQRVGEFLPAGAMTRVIVANAELGGIPDPFEGGLAAYRSCLALLDQVIPQLAAEVAATGWRAE